MNDLLEWIVRPWRQTKEAEEAYESSKAERVQVAALAEDLRRIHEENHITARIHAGFRGDADR